MKTQGDTVDTQLASVCETISITGAKGGPLFSPVSIPTTD